MKLLAWIGYMFFGILVVVLGQLVWNVISVAIAEKRGITLFQKD